MPQLADPTAKRPVKIDSRVGELELTRQSQGADRLAARCEAARGGRSGGRMAFRLLVLGAGQGNEHQKGRDDAKAKVRRHVAPGVLVPSAM